MPGEANKVTANLGRVSIMPKGVYDPEAAYTRLDYVLYGDDGYLARKSGLRGVTPEEGESWMKAVGSGSAAAAKEAAARAEKSAERAAGSVQVIEDNAEAIQAVRDNLADIQTVSGGMTDVRAVGGQLGAVQAVSQGMAAVRTAAENLEAIQAAPDAADRAEAAADSAGFDAERAEEAANRAQSIAQGAKGYYETPETLNESVPEGSAGDWAIVGSTDTIWVWDKETAGWKDSHQATDLSNYYTKEQADEENNKLLAQITQATDEKLAGKLGRTENAVSASRLETARSLKVDLARTAAAAFDGSEDLDSIPVSGTLPPENGGTGVNSLDALYAALKSKIMLDAHPVGSYYWSSNATNPGTLFGGTWAQVKDKFVLAVGDTYKAGASGGAASVTSGDSSAANTGGTAITIAQMPSHAHAYHTFYKTYWDGNAERWCVAYTNPDKDIGGATEKVGGGQAHTHTMAHTHTVSTLPPYETAYCWKRTA